MARQFFQGPMRAREPSAAISDTTAPTFAGITSVTPNTDGSFTVGYSAATDATLPIGYQVYIALGTVSAATLFQSANLALSVSQLTAKVFMLSDWTTYLVNGQAYTLGVRAVDAVGNVDSNTEVITDTAIASGNLPAVFQSLATQMAATELLLAGDHTDFQADHTNFQADHTNFQADHTNLNQAHLDLAQDVIDLGVIEADLAQDVIDLDAIEADLAQDHLDLAQDVVDIGVIEADLAQTSTDLSNTATALAAVTSGAGANAGMVMTKLETFTTVMTIDNDGVD